MAHAGLLLIAAVLIALTALVLTATPRSRVTLPFAAFTFFSSLWTIGMALTHWSPSEYTLKLAFASATLCPASFLAFLRAYPSSSYHPSLVLARACHLGAVAFVLLIIFTPLVASNPGFTDKGLVRQAGPLYPLYCAYIASACALNIYALVCRLRGTGGLARTQLQYLAAGIITSISGALVFNLWVPLFTGLSSHTFLGPYFLTAFVLFTAHSIIRHRLLDLRLVVHRGLTIAIASAVSLLPIGLFLLLFHPLTSDESWVRSVGFLVALIAVTLLVPPTRDLAERLLDRYLYRSRLGFADAVSALSRTLRRVYRLRDLAGVIALPIRSSTGTEGVILFVRDDDGILRAVGSSLHGMSTIQAIDTLPRAIDEALQVAERFVMDEQRSEAVPPTEVQRFLRDNKIAVLQGIVFEDAVIGAIALGPKLSGDPFYAQDLSLLTTLANQAGIAIKNAQLYTEVVLANEYLMNILATIESGVISVNAAGRVLMFNRAAEELTGQSAAAVVGRSMDDALPAALARLLRAARDTGRRHTEPELALAAGEATRPVICVTSPVCGPGGEITGAVAVLSDLTLLKELEAQRQRAERLAYFEMLAAGLAHEIKNPLVAIKTFTQVVPRRARDEAFLEEFSRVAARAIGRMERLVDRLRVLSRPGTRPRQRLDVRTPLRDAVEFLRPVFDEKHLTLTTALPAEPALTVGDEAELEQLFINLLMNAREATPDGGAVEVTLAELDGAVRVTVADAGPGIPPELLSRVCEPFFTTKARGSGLGLAISSAIAQSHGARIWAANRDEGGAVFTVELPTPPRVEASRVTMNPSG